MQDHRTTGQEGRLDAGLWDQDWEKWPLCSKLCGLREPPTLHFNLEVAVRAESLESA